jgi:CubicO group peptidase (beta-lactamase class C family)
VDAVLLARSRWTLGFHKTVASPAGVVPAYRCVLSEDAFGHTGAGGSIGFADPAAGLSFGFVMNQQTPSIALVNAQPLIDATYRALGYTTDSHGFWA